MGNKMKNFLLVVCVVIGMVIALEVFARFLIARQIIAPIPIGSHDTYKFDPRLGWVIEPNTVGRHRIKEFEHPVKNNSLGMRYREFGEKNPGIYRVAVLGDSFTWGYVLDSERFTNRVEELSQNKTEMLNFGVAGYSLLQCYLRLDEILKHNPDMVLFAFYANDFCDSVLGINYGLYHVPYAEISAGGALKIQGYPLINNYDNNKPTWIEQNSYLAYRIRALLIRLASKSNEITQKGLLGLELKDFYIEQEDKSDIVNKALDINSRILEETKNKLREKGIRFVVMEIPSKREYGIEPADDWSNTKNKNYRLRNSLMTLLEKLDIDRIELIDEITPEDFWLYDLHWNASGHEKAARKILEYLNQQGVANTSHN